MESMIGAASMLASSPLATLAAASLSVKYLAGPGPPKGKQVVLIAGDEEYRSEDVMPMLGKILSQRHGFDCTVLFSVSPEGMIAPNVRDSLTHPEALDAADAIVMLIRFRNWPDETMKRFDDAMRRGVPVIGLRTSTHGFQLPGSSRFNSYNSFGKDVLGEQWVSHWGNHQSEATRGVIEPAHAGDPVLRGVSEVFGDSDVYEAAPPPDARILMRGEVLAGMKPTDAAANHSKKRADGQEQPVNEPMMPVAWTREITNAAGKVQKVFCTTMGAATDMACEDLRRLVVNGVYWSLGLDVPAKADVATVGAFTPVRYDFDGYTRGVKPSAHALTPPAILTNVTTMRAIHGEASCHLATPEIEVNVTLRGGHLAPVVFHLSGRDVSPYALAPWEPSGYPDLPPLLAVLRGDFLCLPFGGQADGPPHGSPANAAWTLARSDDRSLHFTMDAADSGAHIDKIIATRAGHHALYAEHRIANLDGDYNYGTHPILDLSKLPEGGGRISTSPFRWASVFPGAFSNPADGETQALAQGAGFSDLRCVPLAAGGTTDLTRYPLRPGNDDLVMMVNHASTADQPFAWSAAVLDGYAWFSIKNPADFPATLLWLSNGGRTAAPWNGRHLGRIGIEEVCSYFSHGVVPSRHHPLADLGIPTTRRFTREETVSLRVIHAAALVPDGFGMIDRIIPHDEQSVAIRGDSGQEITVPLHWSFVL